MKIENLNPMAGRMVKIRGWSKILEVIHGVKIKNNLSCLEVADILDAISDHYRWYSKVKENEFKEEVERILNNNQRR